MVASVFPDFAARLDEQGSALRDVFPTESLVDVPESGVTIAYYPRLPTGPRPDGTPEKK
ncbi:hypothetical protein GCM10010210_49120 [Pseudonocardia hydrocarbonoxydans]